MITPKKWRRQCIECLLECCTVEVCLLSVAGGAYGGALNEGMEQEFLEGA
jgi:hypothetical protein